MPSAAARPSPKGRPPPRGGMPAPAPGARAGRCRPRQRSPGREALPRSRLLLHLRPREVLERLACLRLLLAREIDAVLDEVGPGLGGDLEGLVRRSAGRQLEDAGAVRV